VNFLPAAVVTERIREAHQSESAPLMMLFPGYLPSFFGGWAWGGGVWIKFFRVVLTKLGSSSLIGVDYLGL